MTDGSDALVDAPAAALGAVTDAFSNASYTVEAGEPPSPADDPLSEWYGASWAFKRTAWWSYVGTGIATQVHAQRSFYTPPAAYDADVLVSVYTGTLGSLTLVARGSLADGGFDGTGYAGVGNTATYTPWVANWNAASGITYYIQLASIYDEDIDYRLTVVPTPGVLTGDWLNGDPVEIDTTSATNASIGVKSSADLQPDGDTAAAIAWAGTGTIATTAAVGDLLINNSAVPNSSAASYTVGWYRYDNAWPASASYAHNVPVDEIAQPAHDSTEWASTPQAPGISRRMVVTVNASTSGVNLTDRTGTLKLGAYNPSGPAGTTYNPGFMTPGAVGGLTTLGAGTPTDPPISVAVTTGTDAVAFGIVDHYSLSGSHPSFASGEVGEVGVDVAGFQFLSTAIPQYRYTYTDVPVTGPAATGIYPVRRYPDGIGTGPARLWPLPKSGRGYGGIR